MRLLFLGDIVGKAGRDAVLRELPYLRRALDIDFAVVNAENAAHGFGLTASIANELFDAGADVLVAGSASFKGGPDHYAANIAALRQAG